ncbi:hypothetical protein DICPUDRAFT_150268 [Dictyostelium purpureum]|uniref:Uncharacterized protein n=1 Tax=Dictyostelium purpureum TaxID=5786 RepID=F0ZFW4_DICPU|nr:uncharacterized protein DICPUDRAFT_150268 [Dictyostelium purpureum]EGC37164.1 hypothetical protein DICPUDRAFT_150268 [Dictyostelium purpureum]|eukprot:XP_003286292.1 hypothetical protein DICPUDRAFT_150268 [Dictyostelium purpureum]
MEALPTTFPVPHVRMPNSYNIKIYTFIRELYHIICKVKRTGVENNGVKEQ